MEDFYEQFDNVEEVWFWFCASERIRLEGGQARREYKNSIPRIIEVADIKRILSRMRRNRQINNRELRTMYRWGGIGCSPYYHKRAKNSEIRMWEKSLKTLEVYLKTIGAIR